MHYEYLTVSWLRSCSPHELIKKRLRVINIPEKIRCLIAPINKLFTTWAKICGQKTVNDHTRLLSHFFQTPSGRCYRTIQPKRTCHHTLTLLPLCYQRHVPGFWTHTKAVHFIIYKFLIIYLLHTLTLHLDYNKSCTTDVLHWAHTHLHVTHTQPHENVSTVQFIPCVCYYLNTVWSLICRCVCVSNFCTVGMSYS